MGRISTSIGLITGTPIKDTVDQLIKLSATGRDMLSSRVTQLKDEREAVTALTVKSIGVQLAAKAFGSSSAFQRTSATSSNPDVLSAVRTGTPAAGKYAVRTLQTAATQAFKTAALATADQALGTAGSLTIRGGGFADRSVRLEELNGGRGVASGSIRVTDRSGSVATVDLSRATTIDDVVAAINDAEGIRVRATTDGDALRITDLSGATSTNLRVEEVGRGSTAADLGLRGIDVANSSARGGDILRLSGNTRLDSLRDGRGLGLGSGKDLELSFRNGSAIEVDLGDFSRAASQAKGVTDNAVLGARLTFTAETKGAEGDGIQIRFVDDASAAIEGESAEVVEGPSGKEIVFRIAEGVTTAADIVTAAKANSDVAALVSAKAMGDGLGLVGTADTAVLSGGAEIAAPEFATINDLLRTLNSVDPARLRAEISSDGESIQLTDLTTGSHDFSVGDIGTSTFAADLGIAGESSTGVAVGGRLISGLRSVSLDALGGGQGIGPLGTLQITTRDGENASVDLSAAESLQDVINAINDSGLELEASLDGNGAGVVLRDLSSGEGNAFTVSSLDGTASKLGLDQVAADGHIQGTDLNLQFVTRATRLDTLNQGNGVGSGAFEIRDSQGRTRTIDLAKAKITTVGGLVDAINKLKLSVSARINETGDGIRLVQTADGPMDLRVSDSGAGTTAERLGLAGTATEQLVDGEVVSTINARQVDVISYASSDSLTTLASRIREKSRFANASVLGGQSGLASLSLSSRRGGEAGRISIGGQGLELGIQETTRGRDAVVAIGEVGSAASSVFRSADGVFEDAIEGLSLTAKQLTDQPTTIDVVADHSSLESAVERFVEQYNGLIDQVAELSFSNLETNEVGILFGSNEAIRIPGGLAKVVTGTFSASDTIRSAGTVGLRLNRDGQLEFDKEKFQAAIADDAQAVEDFFTTEESGFVARIDAAVDKISGEDRSLLINRSTELNTQIEHGTERIQAMNERLESQRNRLLKQFFAMESAIAKLQTNQQYISRISYMGLDGSTQN
ncbi:flagellar filament capping protein FliD [Candidatus Laterigemmans baculatus]|uniref:flagellar filament capping protein FliD n=1 Tax=Candidatus Laterigemmans baculatus TaxID=2770505 RepID=UPI0013DCAFA6|nr:flagellar filament capping protein FliD [Candidatus Laterigemmans baculatus]